MRPARTVLALGLAALPLVGCGSSSSSSSHTISNVTVSSSSPVEGQKTFGAAGILIHFKYPQSFHRYVLAPTKRVAGNTGQATHAAVGTGPYDLIVVTRFPKRPIPVTQANIAKLKPVFDDGISAVFGRPLMSTATSVAGLPALKYPITAVAGLPVSATSLVTLVFVADDEYELNCQYTPKGKTAITAACNQMLSTLTTT